MQPAYVNGISLKNILRFVFSKNKKNKRIKKIVCSVSYTKFYSSTTSTDKGYEQLYTRIKCLSASKFTTMTKGQHTFFFSLSFGNSITHQPSIKAHFLQASPKTRNMLQKATRKHVLLLHLSLCLAQQIYLIQNSSIQRYRQ